MGPQLYRCGNVLQRSVWSDGMGASMGPQLYRCGNELKDNYIVELEEELQWGRNFIVAEIQHARIL